MTDVLEITLRLAEPAELDVMLAIDAAATTLFVHAGLAIDLPADHPYVLADARRWSRAVAAGLAHLAIDLESRPVGFMVLGRVDGDPYLDEVAVEPRAMRRGVGKALIAQAWARGGGPLWLTTYGHVPWNAPYYARLGFSVVDECMCGPELRQILAEQRAALPAPEQRVAMVRRA